LAVKTIAGVLLPQKHLPMGGPDYPAEKWDASRLETATTMVRDSTTWLAALVKATQVPPSRALKNERVYFLRLKLFVASVLCLMVGMRGLHLIWQTYHSSSFPSTALRTHCAHIPPIGAEEFLARQNLLAQTLYDLGASAYIAEPGANAQFFGNLSLSLWKRSERPLLYIVSPNVDYDSAGATVVTPRVTVLTPAFEATRAGLLPLPAKTIHWAPWSEDANPYQVAATAIPSLASKTGEKGKIFVDDTTRHFIVDGLQHAVPDARVVSAPVEVKYLRERKSPREIEIMKCVNEVGYIYYFLWL
jgi:hypothetical protein